MFDRYMNILRNSTPPYDWNALKKLAIERKPLPYLFEIKTVHSLASLTEANALADSNTAWCTFLEHIQKEGKWKFTGSNEIFDIHLALLLLEVDCERYADQVKEVICRLQQDGIRKPVLHGNVFKRCLMHLSTISEENCRLATQVAINQDVEVPEELIKNLLKYNLYESFVEILQKSPKNYYHFRENATFVLEKFVDGNCNEVVFQKLVRIMQDNSFICPMSCKHLLKSLLEKFRYNSKFTSVNVTDSLCKSCYEKMSSLPLQDFKECSEKACEVLLKKKDIFLNTTPQELTKFFDFIKSQLDSGSYYDCIVDGLNAINAKCARRYSMDVKSKNELRKISTFNSKKQQMYNLEAVLDHCSSRFKKVLLFGRDHMTNMFESVQIPDNVTFYSLDNNTRDDPFIIYAALQSPDTYILSNDQFGVHKDHMNDEFFNRWLACRLVEIPADFISFKYPPFHEVRVNIGRGLKTLHIPVASFPLGKEWICAHLK